MKKTYNRSEIMTRAWAIRRAENCTMSAAMIKSWAIAKAQTVEKDIVTMLINAGAKRWTKAGKDRIYLAKVIDTDLDLKTEDAPYSMSRSVINILIKTINSAYYDVVAGELVYNSSRYTWANHHVENKFNELVA